MALLLGLCHFGADGTWLLGSKVLTSLPAGLSAWLRNPGTPPGVVWPPLRCITLPAPLQASPPIWAVLLERSGSLAPCLEKLFVPAMGLCWAPSPDS